MDLRKYQDIRKYEALALYYSGESKSSICKKLSIRNRLLKKWIDKDTKSIKEKALHMYFYGFSVDEICKCIFIDRDFLCKWIDQVKRDIAFNVIEKDLQEINNVARKQNGYSIWVDNMFGM